MATGFRPAIVAVSAIVMFAFLVFMFAQSFISANNPDGFYSTNIHYNNTMNKTIQELNSTIAPMVTAQKNIAGKFTNATLNPTEYVFLIVPVAFDAIVAFFVFIPNMVTVLLGSVIPSVFGGGESGFAITFVIGMINALILISFILWGIKAIRSGEVER